MADSADRAYGEVYPAKQVALLKLWDEQLAGWANWAFNVYPLLRPGLCEVYQKMRGKAKPDAPIWVNKTVEQQLKWIAGHVRASDGIVMLDSVEWGLADADITLYTDASFAGMGVWVPDMHLGLQCVAKDAKEKGIFFYEALSVLSALEHILTHHGRAFTRVAILCDNSNTVDMFHSLRAQPKYNGILTSATDLLLAHKAQLRVIHIPGVQNIVADALSRFDNAAAVAADPDLTILPFIPPRLTLGAIQL